MNQPRIFIAIVMAAATLAGLSALRAADVTWNNMAGNFLWNTTDANWSTGAWNNANGDGAVFTSTGVGGINVTTPINVNSLGFLADGYSLNGTGPITLVNGSSSLGTGNIYVDTSLTETINTPINSSLGLSKLGQGTLQLAGPITFSGIGLPATAGTNIIPVDIYAAGLGSESPSQYSGITRIMNTSVLPTTTRLGISNGMFDFGALNIMLGSVTFTNDQDFFPFNPANGTAGVGITGSGPLRVTGDITVLGNLAGFNAGSNSIANNVDFGGGTQVFRVSNSQNQTQWGALQMIGVLSNGSLLKTLAFNPNGVMAPGDGIGLFGNNTYTGSTRIGGGFNVVTGTNASTSVEIIGNSAQSVLSLEGANGSYLSATTIQAFSGGTFQVDNNSGVGGAGSFSPTIAAAQNNNRLADNVQLQLRDGGFTYKGFSNAIASETIGSLSVLGGNNVITLTPSGTGTVTFTVAGNLTTDPRATLTIQSASMGVNAKMFANGTLPTADATGILPHFVSSTDFLTYNAVTGFQNYTGYATDFSTAGTNVAVTAAATVPTSVNVNAVKSTGTFATTIGAGQTLGVTSGMMLSTSGTRTYAGGTIAFGSTPGAFWGSNTVSTSAITGSAGLLNALGTLTLNGDLSGLSGTITQNGFGSTTLATSTFAGAIEVRDGAFNINTSLGAGGAITLGVSANDLDMVGATPLLNISGAGANSTFARDIIVSNGSQTNAGVALGNSFMAGLSPLSASTGSQTISGNITLNTPFRIQGGGTGGTGSTSFTGNLTGPSSIRVINGRMSFSGNYGNAGGFWLGYNGNVTQVTFNGTPGGTAPLVINGSNTGSFIAYTSGALPTGLISTINAGATELASLTPLDSSTINNNFVLNGVEYGGNTIFLGSGSVGANVGSGISATWAGQMSGQGGVVKAGVGKLTLSNAANSYGGLTLINAGTLVGASDGSLGASNVVLNADSVQLTLQNGASNNYIADTATLDVGFTSDSVNLPFTGTDTIKALVINATPQATGTWGSPTSGAMHTDPIFTGTGMLNVLSQLTVTSAVSRKNHGGTNFDVPLPLAPSTPAVESRQGNSTNDYTIIVNFSDAVAVTGNPQASIIAGSGLIGSGGTANGGQVTVGGNTVTIPLTNVTNQQTIQVQLYGVNLFSDFVIPMSVLIGDTNGDGKVNSADIGQTKAQSGNAVTASNFREDVNVDGTINAGDVGLVKSKSGTALP